MSMHWLAYKVVDERVVWMRVIKSDTRPEDVSVINNGFPDPEGMLNLLPHYFVISDAGFITIPPERAQRHLVFLDRVRLAHAIEPLMLWAIIVAYTLIGVLAVLFLTHLLWIR